MRSLTFHFRTALFVVLCFGTLLSCGDDGQDSNPSSTSPDIGLPETPPPPLTDEVTCIVSADCPAGSHCDLGECVQECNTVTPCTQALACSQRARCVTEQAEDIDPVPATEYEGSISASTALAVLQDSDTVLPITLVSTSSKPVRYRVQVEGAHLSIDESRGEFSGSTEVLVKVDGSSFASVDVPGTVRIFTNIGQTSVPANLHAGISGTYRGALSYSDGHVRLGDARIRIALSKTENGVLVWVDPAASLLFPEDSTLSMPAATGSGTFSGEILKLTITQRTPKEFGSERNHFKRDIGRQITFTMKPTSGGGFKGTFEETITGLFVQPVTTTGDVNLAYESREGLTPVAAGENYKAVTLTNAELIRDLPNWAGGDCAATIEAAGLCNFTWASATTEAKAACLGTTLYTANVMPLYNAIGGATPMAYSVVAERCSQQLSATSLSTIPLVSTQTCGGIPIVECATQLAAQSDLTNVNMGLALNKLVDGTINPAMLVAQERMMDALNASIAGSTSVTLERKAYDDAAKALTRAATWIYQPAILEGLRKLPPSVASTSSNETTPPYTTYPGARAISRLLRTMRDLEAERTRLVSLENLDDASLRRSTAQSSALSAYLEGAALNVILNAWGSVSTTVGVETSGLLNPFDSTFGAAISGTGVFGIPDSFVPFVFDPKNTAKGTNNFEQMLTIANAQLRLYGTLEATYSNASKAVAAADYALAEQGLKLRTQYDDRIKQLCGVDFSVTSALASGNVTTCGNTTGDVAIARNQIESAFNTLQGANDQLIGMQDKLAIDLRVMKEKFKLHEENLKFLSAQGEELDVITWTEGIINAEQVALSTASQGNLANGFAPAALAIPMALLELEKTALSVARQDLQTAQQMHFERQTQVAEELDAQANIEKQNIDLAQFNVQIRQAAFDHTTAQLTLANALAEVQLLLEERNEANRISTLDPAKDPSYRMIRDEAAIKMLGARARAQKYLFLAGRALEYELNTPIPDVMKAALVARSASRMETLHSCLSTIPAGISSAQSYTRQVSVRKMLGITSSRVDDCTGEELSEATQFQRALLAAGNLDDQGGVKLRFATNLMPGNDLWSTDVCNDRITTIRAQLVGDFLGDNEAQINLGLTGTAIMRTCDAEVTSWSLGSDSVEGLGTAVAVIQAGVNDFGKATANTSLYGQSVARAQWQLTIPSPKAAPTNSDLDLSSVDDIVLEITHEARPLGGTTALGADLSCLQQVL